MDRDASGGIIETKRIADYCRDAGIGVALHQAGSPVVAMANVHCAAAIDNFIALEMHSVDNPWWDDLVRIVGSNDKKIIKNGYVDVPVGPGLGIELNEEVIEEYLADPGSDKRGRYFSIYPKGLFENTDEWNEIDSHDRTWS